MFFLKSPRSLVHPVIRSYLFARMVIAMLSNLITPFGAGQNGVAVCAPVP
jgi:hypothetical protein